MLQYLINTTAIWLISLVLFDAFLRRESYHSYNRFYLLFTFLLGALLPLWQWQDTNRYYAGAFQKPMEEVVAVKQTIVTATTPAATSVNWQQWLMIIYLAGVIAAICLLVTDIVKMLRFYRDGKRSVLDGWTIVQTAKDHAPFSLMNTLFVSSIKQYNPEEWSMILQHEKRHTELLHFIDLLFMQAARIIFWFHPLVYLYNNRLLMVHEFQADNTSAQKPQAYSKFLVEQALLQTAPLLAHSINRSPIKNRIVMLTHRSSAASRTKMLVFIPLALVCIVCFTKNGFSHGFDKKGNRVTWHGNTFELSELKYDTITLVDPVTGNEITKVREIGPQPIKMNGKPIPQDADNGPVFTGSDKDLRDYLLKNMKEELGKLNDGQYTLNISNILVDENGKIVYFEYDDMKRSEIPAVTQPGTSKTVTYNMTQKTANTFTFDDQPIVGGKPVRITGVNNNPGKQEAINDKNQQEIFDKVCRLMETAPRFEPATTGSKKVVCTYFDVTFWNHFQVKDHKIYDWGKNGEYKEL